MEILRFDVQMVRDTKSSSQTIDSLVFKSRGFGRVAVPSVLPRRVIVPAYPEFPRDLELVSG